MSHLSFCFKVDPLPQFDQLLPAKDLSDWNAHTLVKTNKILDDFYHYTLGLYESVRSVLQNDDLTWFYNARADVSHLKDTVAQLDSTLSKMSKCVTANSLLYAKFEETAVLLLDLQKYSTILRGHCDLATKYNDLNNNVLESVKVEFGGCVHRFDLLKNATGIKPRAQFDWDSLTTRLKLGVSPPIVHLPTFNSVDEGIYNDFVALESRLSPLSISMDIIPQRIDEFLNSSNNFPRYNFHIVTKFDTLSKSYDRLKLDSAQLKLGWLQSKWTDIIRFLCEQVAVKSQELLQHFSSDQYKLVGQVLDFIYSRSKGMGPEYDPIVDAYNGTLLDLWQQISIHNDQPLTEREIIVKQTRTDHALDHQNHAEHLLSSPTAEYGESPTIIDVASSLSFDAVQFLNELCRVLPQQRTQLPLICDYYVESGLPIIKKMAHHHSRIPRALKQKRINKYKRKSFWGDLSWDSSLMDGSIDCDIGSPVTSPAQEYYSKFDSLSNEIEDQYGRPELVLNF